MCEHHLLPNSPRDFQYCSVAEVEVVVGVGVVLALAEHGADEVEGAHGEHDARPHLEAVVDDDAVDEEALEPAIHEVEEPLLGGVGAMVEDVPASVRALLVEVLLAVPGAPLGLGHAQTLAEGQAQVLSVTFLVVGQSTSYFTSQTQSNQMSGVIQDRKQLSLLEKLWFVRDLESEVSSEVIETGVHTFNIHDVIIVVELFINYI